MKLVVATIAALVAQTAASGQPLREHDPDTVKSCIEWYNNYDQYTCQEVIKQNGITLDEFRAWNPTPLKKIALRGSPSHTAFSRRKSTTQCNRPSLRRPRPRPQLRPPQPAWALRLLLGVRLAATRTAMPRAPLCRSA